MNMDKVKQLRNETGAGMLDCKNALIEAKDNMYEAIRILQKKGLAASINRENKPTNEGRLFIVNDVERCTLKVFSVKCETDFVANSELFASLQDAENLQEAVDSLKIATRENIEIGENRISFYKKENVVSTYVHSDHKSGAVVVLNLKNGVEKTEKIQQFAKDCCLHLTAFTPEYFCVEDVPAWKKEEVKEIFKANMDLDQKMACKSDKVKENILANKVLKHFQELSFIDQKFVKDDKLTIRQMLDTKEELKGVTFIVSEFFTL